MWGDSPTALVRLWDGTNVHQGYSQFSACSINKTPATMVYKYIREMHPKLLHYSARCLKNSPSLQTYLLGDQKHV